VKRQPRLVVSNLSPEETDVHDFSDPESMRVLDAIANALIPALAIQAAREDDAAEVAAQKGSRP
jgi:hypothetical protein